MYVHVCTLCSFGGGGGMESFDLCMVVCVAFGGQTHPCRRFILGCQSQGWAHSPWIVLCMCVCMYTTSSSLGLLFEGLYCIVFCTCGPTTECSPSADGMASTCLREVGIESRASRGRLLAIQHNPTHLNRDAQRNEKGGENTYNRARCLSTYLSRLQLSWFPRELPLQQ